MIRRTEGSGFVLINQDDHARLSGELARHVGNAHFSPPTPFEDVIAAISLHDSGWSMKDMRPALNEDGYPQHVFETHAGEALIFQAWDASVDRAAERSAYAGLLVSLHVMHLSLRALGSVNKQNGDSYRPIRFKLNQFHHRQIERQEFFRRALGLRTDEPVRFGLSEPGRSSEEDLLLANFYLLQAMDQISLNFCFDECRFTKIEPIYPQPRLMGAAMHIARIESGVFRMDPWPFDAPVFRFEIPARRIAARRYTDEGALAEAIASASVSTISVTTSR